MIRRNIEVTLTKEEEMIIVRKWAKDDPKSVNIMLVNPRGNCPFPDECDSFPCRKLNCNADVCNNGHAYRMS